MAQAPFRRSAAPWLFGLAALLTLLAPFLFLAVWVAQDSLDGVVTALLVTLADLAAAVVAAVVATVLAAQRGITRVRTAVTGHPQGRAGRMAEHHAARWHLARDRFTVLRSEWAAFEADRGAVARRPALTDVTVPATARFVEAFGDAEYLLTSDEPSGPRKGEFVAAVDRAVEAWTEAQRVADEMAAADGGPTVADGPTGRRAVSAPHAPGPQVGGRETAPEYAQMADAVRRAARRGVSDLRGRLKA